MIIQCTAKMLNELKIEPEMDAAAESPLFAWHCNLIKVERRKMVLLVNDLTRICVVLYGLTAPYFKRFSELARTAMGEVLLAEGIDPAVVERYLADGGEVHYTKTGDKSLLGKMNRIAMDMEFFTEDLLEPAALVQERLSHCFNQRFQAGYDKDYIVPIEELRKQMVNNMGTEAPPRLQLVKKNEKKRDLCEHCQQKGITHHLTLLDGRELKLCSDCFNQEMASSLGLELEPFEQREIAFKNTKGKQFKFLVSRLVLPMMICYEAEEFRRDRQPGRKISQMAQLPCDEKQLWQEFCAKVKRYLDKDYLKKEKDFYGGLRLQLARDEAAGYLIWSDDNQGSIHDVVIDGKKFTWDELGRMLSPYEGFQFQLKILDRTEDLSEEPENR